MPGPLLSSKYRRPEPRPGAVPRARLAQRLARAPRAALTVVSAPAGFGKTTLLTEALSADAADRAPVAWVSLDPGDNDPAVLWTYVVTALQTAAAGIGHDALELLTSSPPAVDDALTALLNEIDALSTDVVLVLDDYHLIESPEIHAGMTFVLEHQPRHLHVVLATRSDPPLPLAQLRARGRLVEIRAADLRFTTEEAAAYLNGPMELALDLDDITALEARTEGWIAALQLAALSLQGRDDPSAFIAGFAGDDRYVVDYLAEEVLARQPVDVRDFLLETSILTRLTGPLCDAVTGTKSGRATLVALERANLFLVPLDDRRQWFRYHHLFADVLRVHLLDERPVDVPEAHRRASIWFAANDDTSQAIDHAQAAGDVDRAADLMELAVPEMSRDRREAEFLRWVRAVPDDVLARRPVLGVAFAGALAQVSEFGTVGERLDTIEAALRPAGADWPVEPPPGMVVVDQANYRSLPAHVEMYRAALALGNGELNTTITHAQQALTLAAPDDALTRAAAGALAGLASWSTGDLAGALAAYTESAAGLRGIGFLPDLLGCTVTLGDLHRTRGALTAAELAYRDALASAAPGPDIAPSRGTADMHVGIAGVELERGDLDGARAHLAAGLALGESNGLPQNPYRWRVVTARLRGAEGDLDAALALLDEAVRVYVGDFAPSVQPVAAVRARLRIRRGELVDAQEWARERGLSALDDPVYLREYEHLTLARLLLARYRTEHDTGALHAVSGLLEKLLPAAERGGRGASVIEVLLLQALVRAAAGTTSAAVDVLRRAVTLAQPERFVRVFADEGAPMAALLRTLIRQPPSPSYTRVLLDATTVTETSAPAPRTLVQPLSDRELAVLRLLAGDLDGPDIARHLSVTLNTLRTHTRNIYLKLGVTNRRAAVGRARDLDLVPGRAHR